MRIFYIPRKRQKSEAHFDFFIVPSAKYVVQVRGLVICFVKLFRSKQLFQNVTSKQKLEIPEFLGIFFVKK